MSIFGHFRRNIGAYSASLIIGLIGTLVVDECLAKKYFLDLNDDRIQDMAKVTPIFHRTFYYLGQKDGTYEILDETDKKELEGLNRELEEDGIRRKIELQKQQKEREKAFEEKFRQCLK